MSDRKYGITGAIYSWLMNDDEEEKAGEVDMSHILTISLNEQWKAGVWYSCYKMADKVLLKKPDKPDYTVRGAYRDISLLKVRRKTCMLVLTK
jgi:hypothetical protein